MDFLSAFWHNLSMMAPYLLFGFMIAGILSVVIAPAAVERHLGGRGMWPIIKATLFGIPLPLCSCGVIPVAASLRKNKASKGATVAFLLSTPQTGVDSIFVTLSLLGPVIAVFRPLAAFFSGVLGGSLVDMLEPEVLAATELSGKCGDARALSTDSKRGFMRRAVSYGFVTLPRDIARPMLLGLAAAGVISWIVPPNFFAEILGEGIIPKLVMMLVGIPVYVCATASTPVAAALIAKGISPGAALVFLMTGPATNIAALAIVWKMLGKRSTFVYLGTIAVLSIFFGFLLDSIFNISGIAPGAGMPWMFPEWLRTVSAVVLLGILVKAAFEFPKKGIARSADDADWKLALRINGMTCSHCVEIVRRAILELPGVSSADVDLKTGMALVTSDSVDVARILRTISELGYSAEVADSGASRT